MERARRARILLAVALVSLAASACARVVPPLSFPPLVLGEPSFFPTLEAYASAPIVGGNRVDLLLNGEEIFPAMLDAVPTARRSVTLAQYYFDEGPVARLMAAALAERSRAGVPIHVLLDGFGSMGVPAAYLDTMRAAGCEVVMFRPIGPNTINRANNRGHRRILVIDGRVGFTGGSGMTWQWMGNGRVPGHWRETDVRVEGPAVQYLQGAFVENWLEATGQVLGGDAYFPRPLPAAGQVYAQVVRSSAAGGGYAMYTTLLLAIAAARHTILITNPYFLPDRTMQVALLAAARRGVRVAVLAPGPLDSKLVRVASRRHWGPLLRVGIEFYQYEAALLHAKTMVIDGVWSSVGSTNFDNRSFAVNDELDVVVYDRGLGRRLEAVFADDLTRARRLSYDDWRHRGFQDRLMEWLAIPLLDHF